MMSNYGSVNRLDDMAIEDVIKEFKEVYRDKGKYDLKSQVPYLARLAQHYVQEVQSSDRPWVELL